jgi:hypothetical protein
VHEHLRAAAAQQGGVSDTDLAELVELVHNWIKTDAEWDEEDGKPFHDWDDVYRHAIKEVPTTPVASKGPPIEPTTPKPASTEPNSMEQPEPVRPEPTIKPALFEIDLANEPEVTSLLRNPRWFTDVLSGDLRLERLQQDTEKLVFAPWRDYASEATVAPCDERQNNFDVSAAQLSDFIIRCEREAKDTPDRHYQYELWHLASSLALLEKLAVQPERPRIDLMVDIESEFNIRLSSADRFEQDVKTIAAAQSHRSEAEIRIELKTSAPPKDWTLGELREVQRVLRAFRPALDQAPSRPVLARGEAYYDTDTQQRKTATSGVTTLGAPVLLVTIFDAGHWVSQEKGNEDTGAKGDETPVFRQTVAHELTHALIERVTATGSEILELFMNAMPFWNGEPTSKFWVGEPNKPGWDANAGLAAARSAGVEHRPRRTGRSTPGRIWPSSSATLSPIPASRRRPIRNGSRSSRRTSRRCSSRSSSRTTQRATLHRPNAIGP